MQPGVRRHNFTSSDLTRLLAELCLDDGSSQPGAAGAAAAAEHAEGAQSFGERLGQWLNWTDAIALSAALSGAPAPAPPGPVARTDMQREVARTQATLAQAIAKAGAQLAKDELEAATDFAPLRRHVTAQQRAMETALQPLRAQLRARLTQTGAGGARLAALDAVLDNALAPRERAVLAQVPTLLEERHARLRAAHRAALAERAAQEVAVDAQQGPPAPAGPSDETEEELAAAEPPHPWLPGLHKDINSVLLAELDLRLQPVLGLLEALQHEQGQA